MFANVSTEHFHENWSQGLLIQEGPAVPLVSTIPTGENESRSGHPDSPVSLEPLTLEEIDRFADMVTTEADSEELDQLMFEEMDDFVDYRLQNYPDFS